MEVEEAELVEGGERVDGAAEVEEGEREGDYAGGFGGGAVDALPGGGAGGGGRGGEGPVGEEVAVGVGLRAEEEESGGVVGWRREREGGEGK